MSALRNFLEGKWLGHPLHPVLVHLPIGLFVLSFVLDLFSFFIDWELLGPASFYCLVAGIVAGLVASVPGFVDFSEIRRDAPARKKARLHMILNLTLLALFAASAGLRDPFGEATAVELIPFGLSLVAIGVLFYSGYVGAELVYDEGVGVGRHRRSCALPDETATRTGAPGEFVLVADAANLEEGQSLRARINGTEIAVAKVNGTVYAFQDYCSHRYAPLSEGTFQEGCVTCPWHNSKFDLATGQVKQGPAKVPLKVFPVRVRDGKIEVQAEGRGS